jgi:Yip1 domain
MAVDTPKANGLKTVVDTIVAPKEAFESIRVAPTWTWALLIAIVLVAISSYLLTPALVHAYPGTFAQQVATDPRLSGMSQDQQQTVMAFGEKAIGFGWIFAVVAVPFFALIAGVIMLIFDKIGRGQGSFAKYWAAACNIGIPAFALGAVVSAIIVLVRGADSFSTVQAVQEATPSLAMLAPAAGAKMSAFLAVITPFALWGLVLNVVAMRTIGRVGAVPAWLAGLAIILIPALLAMAGAK